ncbi:MAG: hypothetical protein OEL77_08550 [Nitrosopumilus sp.]|nr:hypothetical protein [Nitrosopumilus sp.]MDH3386045.1 hypothetical protein [Nitrosopumilus sp.]
MWKLDLDEEYFRIYDSGKLIAGYFDPDYGNIYPKKNSDEIISQMLKNHDKIPGGFIMVPMVKFGLFDTDLETDVNTVNTKVNSVLERLSKWREFFSNNNITKHYVRISHTDQDMLTVTFPIKFSKPTPLDKKDLVLEITPTLDTLQKLNLL